MNVLYVINIGLLISLGVISYLLYNKKIKHEIAITYTIGILFIYLLFSSNFKNYVIHDNIFDNKISHHTSPPYHVENFDMNAGERGLIKVGKNPHESVSFNKIVDGKLSIAENLHGLDLPDYKKYPSFYIRVAKPIVNRQFVYIISNDYNKGLTFDSTGTYSQAYIDPKINPNTSSIQLYNPLNKNTDFVAVHHKREDAQLPQKWKIRYVNKGGALNVGNVTISAFGNVPYYLYCDETGHVGVNFFRGGVDQEWVLIPSKQESVNMIKYYIPDFNKRACETVENKRFQHLRDYIHDIIVKISSASQNNDSASQNNDDTTGKTTKKDDNKHDNEKLKKYLDTIIKSVNIKDISNKSCTTLNVFEKALNDIVTDVSDKKECYENVRNILSKSVSFVADNYHGALEETMNKIDENVDDEKIKNEIKLHVGDFFKDNSNLKKDILYELNSDIEHICTNLSSIRRVHEYYIQSARFGGYLSCKDGGYSKSNSGIVYMSPNPYNAWKIILYGPKIDV